MHKIVKVRVTSMYETCERWTFYVELETDEGFKMTPESHRTGSIYTNHAGLSIGEARDRALIMANQWADFLGLEVEPFIFEGVEYYPTMLLDIYTTRRELARRQNAEV